MKDSKRASAGMLVCLHPSRLSIIIEPNRSDQIILNTRMSSKRIAKYWRVGLWNVWQIALQNEVFRGSLLNTQTRWKSHTRRAMTYRAGAASPPSQPSLHRPGGFCRSSLIFRRPPCLLRSPCSPWSNRARVKLQRISQIGCKLSTKKTPRGLTDAIKARSVTIWKLWFRKSLACDSPSIRRVRMCVDAIKKLLSFPPNQSINLPSFSASFQIKEQPRRRRFHLPLTVPEIKIIWWHSIRCLFLQEQFYPTGEQFCRQTVFYFKFKRSAYLSWLRAIQKILIRTLQRSAWRSARAAFFWGINRA